MVSSTDTDLWTSLPHTGVRCMTLEGTDYLFLERGEPHCRLSAETARTLSRFAHLTSDSAVSLLDHRGQVEALVDLYRVEDLSLRDLSSICVIGFSTKLGERLGTWTRHRRLPDDFWLLEFASTPSPRDSALYAFERQILEPWVAGLSSTRFHIEVKTEVGSPLARLLRTEAAHYESLGRVLHQMYRGISKGFSNSHRTSASKYDLDFLHATADLGPLILRSYEQVRFLQHEVHRFLKSSIVDAPADSPSARSSLEADKSTTAVDVDAVVGKLETATENLDAIYETLSSASDSDDEPEPTLDPIKQAIEIRQRLQQTVRFVEATEWATWRGVTSNPSAALGKYKRQGRVFAVRSGNRDLYPAFQFSENAEPLPILEEILKVVPDDAQGWPLLSWFEAENVLLGNRKPSEVLTSDPVTVLEAAARFYSQDD